MIYALLPAAGHSTRMGRPKLLLPLGANTVVERVVASVRQAGVANILVVIGPHVPEILPLACQAGADTLLLVLATTDMRQTIEHGLEWIENNWNPSDDDAFLLIPADHPVIEADVVRDMISRFDKQRDILIPTFEGQRGHPTLIGWRHVKGIRALPASQGLNAYLRARPEQVFEIPVASGSILLDLDTPEDYEKIVFASS
ncbi:MAG: nucleotidyltransferase family protein [Planctomycetes bacterium]|nr:nucleotidyltransferase family protein [Planctomycetota bacterium]